MRRVGIPRQRSTVKRSHASNWDKWLVSASDVVNVFVLKIWNDGSSLNDNCYRRDAFKGMIQLSLNAGKSVLPVHATAANTQHWPYFTALTPALLHWRRIGALPVHRYGATPSEYGSVQRPVSTPLSSLEFTCKRSPIRLRISAVAFMSCRSCSSCANTNETKCFPLRCFPAVNIIFSGSKKWFSPLQWWSCWHRRGQISAQCPSVSLAEHRWSYSGLQNRCPSHSPQTAGEGEDQWERPEKSA